MRKLKMLLAVSVLTLAFSGNTEDGVESLVKIEIGRREEVRNFVEMRLTITDRGADYVKAIVSQEELDQLKELGYKVEILIEDMAHALDWLKALPDRGEYHSYAELVADLTTLVNSYPGITHLDTIGYSVQGRALLALKITDNPDRRENEPEVRIIGCHHGNEAISVEVPLSLAHYLCEQYGGDPEVTHLVDNREIWIIPMMNPDGLEAGTRRNANSVDLNRDYGYMWEGWGGSQAPYSQPETKAIYLFSQEHNFSLSLSHHSGAEYVNYLWNYTPILTQDDSLIVDLSYGYASYSNYPVTNGWQWYETHGDCNDYSYGIDGDIDWTIELSYSYTPPPSAIDSLCERNREAQIYIIKKAGQGVAGFILDAVTGDTIKQAMVNVEEVDWPVYVDPHFGDYHRVLLPGVYTVTATANGYFPQTIHDVEVFEDSTTLLDFSLEPGGGSYAYKFVWANVADPANEYNNHTLTPHALGLPDGQFLSIGVGGDVVLDMGPLTPIADLPGFDFTIYEGNDGIDEGYEVYLSNDWDGPWISLATGSGTQSFDISEAGFSQARYVRLIDDGDGNPNGPYAGFDLDAIESSPISGPYLSMETYEIDDWQGNDDGRFDPGEIIDLYVTLKNFGGDSALFVQAQLSQLEGESYTTILDSTASFGDLPPGGTSTNSGDPFTIMADSNTPSHYQANYTLIVQAEGGYADSFELSLTVGIGGDFLVLDLDPDHSSGPIFKATLDSLQYQGIYDTTLTPYFDEIPAFKSIFVCVGIYSINRKIMDGSPEAESLVSYLLNHHGKMYLEGGDVWCYDPDHGGYDFAPLFGIDPIADGSGDLSTILGTDGTFTQGMVFSYIGQNNYIDRIAPTGTGFAIFSNESPSYICGVANDAGTYRTVGVSFEFGGLESNRSNRHALADSIMHFFEIYSNYPPEQFSLLSPPDGDTASLPLLLQWEEAQDPDPNDTVLYRLSVSLSEVFNPDSTLLVDSLTDNEYLLENLPVSEPLGNDRAMKLSIKTGSNEPTLYYWKVVAFDKRGSQTPSHEVFRFYIAPEPIPEFVRGDAQSNMMVGMEDAVFILRYKFIPGSPVPSCMDAADADDNGEVGMEDAVYILRYKFIPGSPQPPPPFPECGSDPTPDELDCGFHPCMESFHKEIRLKREDL